MRTFSNHCDIILPILANHLLPILNDNLDVKVRNPSEIVIFFAFEVQV